MNKKNTGNSPSGLVVSVLCSSTKNDGDKSEARTVGESTPCNLMCLLI